MRTKAILTCFLLSGALLFSMSPVMPAFAQRSSQEGHPDSPTGQSDMPTSEKSADSGFLTVGVQFADLTSLNDQLEDAGYPTFNSELFSAGIGARRGIGDQWFVAGEVTGLFSPSQGFQGRDVTLGGARLMPSLGYTFLPTERLRVYPEMGVGAEAVVLNIGASGEASSFEGVLDDPDRSATLTHGSLVVRIGAGTDYRLTGPDGQARLGLQTGYALTALSSDWELSGGGSVLGDGPDSALSGFYLRLIVDDLL